MCTPADRSSASEKVQRAGADSPCPATGNAGQVKGLDQVKEGGVGIKRMPLRTRAD